MKTILIVILIISSNSIFCQENKSIFAVYEVINKKEVNAKIIQTLESSEFIIDKDEKSPFIAFYLISAEEDALKILKENSENDLTLLPSKQTFGENKEYKGVIALKNKSDINVLNIKKTKANNYKLEVYLDYPGAKIWTDYTERVKGKLVGFTINNKVFDMPLMMAQIKTGTLIINGFSDKDETKKYAELLNQKK